MAKLNQKQLVSLMDNQQEIFNYLMKEKEKLMKLAQFEQRTVPNIKKHFDASLKWWLKFQANHESLLPHKALWPDVYHHAVKESRMAMVEIKEFVAKFASTVLEGVEGLENLEESDDDKQLSKSTPENEQPVNNGAGGSKDDDGNRKTVDLLSDFSTTSSAPSSTTTTVTNSVFSPLFSPRLENNTFGNFGNDNIGKVNFGNGEVNNINLGEDNRWANAGGGRVNQPTDQGAVFYQFRPETGFVPVTAPPPSNKMEEIFEMLARNQVNQATSQGNNDGGCFRTETVVPTFDGNIKQFQAFKETFEKAVQKISSRIERFIILRSKLQGRAATAIENLTLTEKNYENAWQMLDTWFGNERNLKTTTVMELMNAPQTIPGDADSLLSFLQLVLSTLNNMADLGCDIENDFAVVMCISKFDPITLARFEDLYGVTTKLPTTAMICEFLEREYTVCHARILANKGDRKKK